MNEQKRPEARNIAISFLSKKKQKSGKSAKSETKQKQNLKFSNFAICSLCFGLFSVTDTTNRQYPTVGATKSLNTRQLMPQNPSRPRSDKQKEQTIPDSWGPKIPQGPKLTNKKNRQYSTAGALESLKVRN